LVEVASCRALFSTLFSALLSAPAFAIAGDQFTGRCQLDAARCRDFQATQNCLRQLIALSTPVFLA